MQINGSLERCFMIDFYLSHAVFTSIIVVPLAGRSLEQRVLGTSSGAPLLKC
jgi:hypothetical protein